ncbi:MAG: ABC transporter permease [Ectothiorhodospiraceae bacterium]|nr:ABC transporter permease [Chromatiales bacterium]MCP5153828.1 ABC transporter permease [Ectothiorhodospiraceae bacterium]
MAQALVLSARLLAREWRAGELRVLAVALVVAVAAVVAVSGFTDRMDRAMASGAAELLGADLVVSSTEPQPTSRIEAATAAGLAATRTLTTRSVVAAGDALQLVELKAVEPGYPLRGQVRTALRPFDAGTPADAPPAPGEAWVDARLAGALGLAVGDGVDVGATRLTVARILVDEPDRGGDVFQIAPRLMMRLEDIPATELVQPGSRVRHRLLVAGPAAAVERFRLRIEPTLGPSEEVQGVRDARPEMRAALDRAQRFLGLASLVSVVLAGAGVAVAARRHATRHYDAAALLRCFGASRRRVLALFVTSLAGLGTLASLVGVGLGYLAQSALAGALGALVMSELPPPGPEPALQGLAVGLLVLIGFALAPMVGLARVPPARVLRRDLGPTDARAVLAYGAALAVLVVLVAWNARDASLAGWTLAGAAGAVAVLALGARVLIALASRLRGRVGVAWRFGIANIARRADSSLVQMVALGLGLTLLLLLTLVRRDLLAQWQGSLPAQTPNYFLINVQPDDVPALGDFLSARGLERAALHPMVRGRLTAVNGDAVDPDAFGNPRAQRLAAREFNLSWASTLQADNRIVGGRWWSSETTGAAEISIEEGIARTLGIALGDEMTFTVAGTPVSGRVTSVRSVQWDSFRANFFVLFPPGVLDDFPATWMTSFHLPAAQRDVLVDLVRAHPSVTVIDIDALLVKVREIMDRASLGVQYVFLFTLAAGMTVLFAAMQSTLDERRYETALMRTLGAARAQVTKGLVAEFAALGLLAGLLAAGAAALAGMVVAEQVFAMTYRPGGALWVSGLAAGGLGVALAGWLGTRAVLEQPPLVTLRGL